MTGDHWQAPARGCGMIVNNIPFRPTLHRTEICLDTHGAPCFTHLSRPPYKHRVHGVLPRMLIPYEHPQYFLLFSRYSSWCLPGPSMSCNLMHRHPHDLGQGTSCARRTLHYPHATMLPLSLHSGDAHLHTTLTRHLGILSRSSLYHPIPDESIYLQCQLQGHFPAYDK